MYVFVYGTLTEPAQVDELLAAGQYAFAGRATLEGLHRVDGRYPTLAPSGHVDGRLLAVDSDGLERLDRYEGVDDDLYVRVSAPIETEGLCPSETATLSDDVLADADDGSSTRDGESPTARDDEGPSTRFDETAELYVGDPVRLGLGEPVWWPPGNSLLERVRTLLEGVDFVVQLHE